MNWNNVEIDYVKPICMFAIPKDVELREAFCWKNTQPILNEIHQQKEINFNFLHYQTQFITTYQFCWLNEEEPNQNIR